VQRIIRVSIALATGLVLLPHRLPAQSVSVSAVASTFGVGGEASYRLSRSFGVRGGYYTFTMERVSDVEDVRYQITPRFRNGVVAADLFPFGGAFRLSAGAALTGTRADGLAELSGPIDLGGRTWEPEDVGQLLARADYPRRLMPFLGLGFAGNGRITPTFDLGLAFSGHPDVRLTVHSPLTGAERAALDASVAEEEASIRQSIRDQSWARYYPVMALGLKLRW
jgi:hypothetical protein